MSRIFSNYTTNLLAFILNYSVSLSIVVAIIFFELTQPFTTAKMAINYAS